MTDRSAGPITHLEIIPSEAGTDIESLLLILEGMKAAGESCLQIHCSKIAVKDTRSLKFLLVLVEWARLKGIALEIVDLTEDIKTAVHELGAMQCFSDLYPLKIQGESMYEGFDKAAVNICLVPQAKDVH